MDQEANAWKPVAERIFEVTFVDPGIHTYAFTFG
jgi:hypothetical protein